jgi:hypothetical protein
MFRRSKPISHPGWKPSGQAASLRHYQVLRGSARGLHCVSARATTHLISQLDYRAGNRTGERRKGQAIFLCGQHDCGKSFLQNYIITPLLGGRVALPYKYLNGDTQFNSELFAAEHLCLDDDVPFTDSKARRRFGTYIKSVTASDCTPCFTKYRTPVTLSPFWRLTVSTNDEPENLMIIPVLDESLIDKVMLFETAKHPMPMPTATDAEREAFRFARSPLNCQPLLWRCYASLYRRQSSTRAMALAPTSIRGFWSWSLRSSPKRSPPVG